MSTLQRDKSPSKKPARSLTRRFTQKSTLAKNKNSCVHKLLVFIGLREEEEEVISEEEKLRRYQIAMNGWKKVRRTLLFIRTRGAEQFQTNSLPTKKTSMFAYSSLVVSPNSRFAFIWKTIKALIITYNLIMVPYRVSFNDYDQSLLTTDYVLDIFSVLDIIFNFFFAYNRRTKVIKEFKLIAIHYAITQLWIDLISIFPYYWTQSGKSLYFLRYFRFLQIFWAKDQLRIFCESFFMTITSNINIIKSLARIVNFTMILAIIGNLLASIWYSLGQQKDVNVGNTEEVLIDGWIETGLNGTLNTPILQDNDRQTLYIASLYWTFATLSTLGYGDIVGSTTSEYVYTMFVEFIGVFLFAYMMSNINNLIERLDDDHVEILENKAEELDQWIIKIDRANRDRKLPEELVNDIKKFYQNYWRNDHTMIQNDDSFLNQMPRDLRSDLIRHLFQKFIDRFNVFFEGAEDAFIDEIVINLVPRKFAADTDIIKVDHGTKYVYFIIKGKVTICSQDAIEKYLVLDNNTYFGEHLIFFNLRSSNAFRACDEEVECMCLPKAKFVELCEEFPSSAKILKYKGYLRRKQFRKAKLDVQAANGKKLLSQKSLQPTFPRSFDNTDQREREDQTRILEDPNQILEEKEEDDDVKSEVLDGKKNDQNSNRTSSMRKPYIPIQEDQNVEVEGEQFLEHAKKLKNALDRIERQINFVESDLTKKLKNIKYYIGYISSIEDFLPSAS